MIQERANLPTISPKPIVAGASKKSSRAFGQATKSIMNMISRGELNSADKDDSLNFCYSWVVAVRQLDRSGTLATKEFLVEILMLSLLRHPNLVSLVGYCADGDQRLLVYEYMPSGSLDDYLFAYGYFAPEYERQGESSLKSDVHNFAVVLLELIIGR
ncbi:unnamed protein product [Fraxinus pennsylvanica]|uniref:Protein kinase domain-containing protein n=1 Tax=Fraxinus pennsylvanica TaxID=56036 RepID=A0AAD2DXY8_9LAMI|nr:unnamed protein product [Fraxinus pennsylvanica]